MTPVKVLVPLGTDSFSRKIIPQLGRLFPPATTDLIFLHVRRPEAFGEGYSEPLRYGYEHAQTVANPHTYDKEGLDALGHELKARLERDAVPFAQQGYRTQTVLRRGDPVEEIVALAKALQVGAVAMATHGHTGFGQFLFGSVAQGVLVRVGLPVVLLCTEEASSGA